MRIFSLDGSFIVWRFIMHGPDGTDYKNEVVYAEVVKPERLVYDHVSGRRFHVTVTFPEEGNKSERLNQTLGRLQKHLANGVGDKT